MMRLPGGTGARGYKGADLADAFARYLE